MTSPPITRWQQAVHAAAPPNIRPAGRLCGNPLPPWTDLLRSARIPDSPGHLETAEHLRSNPRPAVSKPK